MSGSDIPPVLKLKALGDNRYDVHHPAEDFEGRNVIFSGQIMGQAIMAVDDVVGGGQDIKSIHSVFSRAGTYDDPMTLEVDPTHTGRTFGNATVTAYQGDRLLSRSSVLVNAYEDHMDGSVHHGPEGATAPDPESLPTGEEAASHQMILGYPEVEFRVVVDPDETAADGTAQLTYWVRHLDSSDSVAANQAMLAWSQPGNLIGLSLRPHDVGDLAETHVTLSTGVIAHTAHFHERFDASEWLLVRQSSTSMGHGRVYGEGRVFDRSGVLVSTFSQDSMIKRPDRPMDRTRSM